MTTSTTPTTVYNTVVSGTNVQSKAGIGTYVPTATPDLTVYAISTAQLVANQTYTVTGVVVGSNTSVTFPDAVYVGPAQNTTAIATFTTSGWQDQ